jgi:hypothetical protein
MIKICKKCNIEKPLENFYKEKKIKDGYRNSCKQCDIVRISRYNSLNKERHRDVQKKWRSNNRYKDNKRCYDSYRKRLKNNISFRVSTNIAQIVRKRLKKIGSHKQKNTASIIGCSTDFLKSHLESLFQTGMTWENYGLCGWHIDHICPISQAISRDDAFKLNHYSNLQPLWAKDNRIKSDSKTEEAESMCIKLLDREWINV